MPRRAACHNIVQLIRRQRFEFHQRIGHGVQLIDIFRQQILRRAVAFIDNLAYFLINRIGCFW